MSNNRKRYLMVLAFLWALVLCLGANEYGKVFLDSYLFVSGTMVIAYTFLYR